jgi:hypothetical protein
MTASLQKAFAKASRLPLPLQEELAAQLLDDMKAEAKWDRTLAKSQPLLERLAAKALAQKSRGRTKRGGFDGR